MGSADRTCDWCRGKIPEGRRADARTCETACRQALYRLRRRRATAPPEGAPARFAYADPPYPGRASYYRDQPSYAGEVDHRELVRSLEAGAYAGWALSTAADSLELVLGIFRELGVEPYRVCAWVKPIAPNPNTYGLHNTWEPLLVVRGRQERPGKRDWLRAQPARFEGDLIGRKPLAFCAWLFECLGMRPGDELVDLFPGTGVVSRSWAELSRRGAAAGDGSVSGDPEDASSAPRGGVSPAPEDEDASRPGAGDESSRTWETATS